jgi:hypothetical protein
MPPARVRKDARFLALVRRLESLLEEASATFEGRHLSHVLNGLANLEHHPGEGFMKKLTKECERRDFGDFNSQNLANTLNGLAKFEYHPGKAFMGSFTRVCLRRDFRDFNSQNFANTINGLAKLKYDPGTHFLERFTRACLRTDIKTFNSQGLANVINGFGSFGHHPGKAFMERFTGELLDRNLGDFTRQGLTNVMNGFANVRHHPGEQMLLKFQEELLRREFAGFNPQDSANLISAMAVLVHRPSDACLSSFLKACKVCARVALQRRGKQSDAVILKHVSSLLWSLRALKALERPDSDELFEALAPLTEALLIAEAAKHRTEKDVATKRRAEAVATDFVTALEYALLGHPRSSPGLQKLCGAVKRTWWGPEVPPPLMKADPSRWQREVTREFRRLGLGLEVREEVWVGGGRVSVDILVGGEGGVAVEVDGPTHFFRNRPSEPTGATSLKHELLQGLVDAGELKGFISVGYREWGEAKKKGQQAELLRRLLREAGLKI